MHMRNIKLIIEYEGTGYHGWQSQVNAAAIQDVLSSAIEKLTGEKTSLTGSGRTDTGVHALGQVANFHTASNIPADKFTYALNSILPDDIVVKKSEEADESFHSRFSAIGKKYKYLFYNSALPSALLRHRAWHIYHSLDTGAIAEGAKYFLGTHDFKAFMSTGSSIKSTIRNINEISIISESTKMGMNIMNSNLCLEIAGDGFLYNMVRIIAGTLVQIGYGKIRPEYISEIIESGDRKKAGKTAPAHGLYLVEVYY